MLTHGGSAWTRGGKAEAFRKTGKCGEVGCGEGDSHGLCQRCGDAAHIDFAQVYAGFDFWTGYEERCEQFWIRGRVAVRASYFIWPGGGDYGEIRLHVDPECGASGRPPNFAICF